ncbi:DUF7674 family protein [Methylovulum psychrotolerans]|uniref:DUF7674 domain-containing protein n=1 Tax=Methylovulum psychrotolerans TaxID=1704499 RepID=A0A1Z4C3B9_9GAMM|nr:hypothetical protein [Methylovulum psychrotolerans]ASF47980.1 hypothetical protein CEK71_18975 [Methylovulum psychrotolerans]
MPVLEMYEEFRVEFPELTAKSDIEHCKYWGEVDPEFAYSWFGSLANTLNKEMSRGIDVKTYKNQFEFFHSKYITGDSEVKNCIDVSFIENLFWQVVPEKALPYWQALPLPLKELYLDFYGHSPR